MQKMKQTGSKTIKCSNCNLCFIVFNLFTLLKELSNHARSTLGRATRKVMLGGGGGGVRIFFRRILLCRLQLNKNYFTTKLLYFVGLILKDYFFYHNISPTFHETL